MQKVGIQIEETLTYTGEIVVEQPEGMSDDEFNTVLNKAESRLRRFGIGGSKEFAHELQNLGLKVVEHSESFPDSPSAAEFEIFDVYNKK